MSDSLASLLGPRKENPITILGPRNPRSTQITTEAIAEALCDKLGSPEYKNFYLKAAWALEEDTLMRLATAALECGREPRAYFIASVKREVARRQRQV